MLSFTTASIRLSSHRALSRSMPIAALSSSANSNNSNSNSNKTLPVAALLSLSAAAALIINCDPTPSPAACGIVGIVSQPNAAGRAPAVGARAFLIEGLTVLKNRGYDSAGLATLGPVTGGETKMLVTKFASVGENADGVALVDKGSAKTELANVPKGMTHSVGIAHTRWATHGGKTDENSHPHLDTSEAISVVHNGTINNANELRKELQAKGHVFSSQTDTEVVAKLIGDILSSSSSSTTKEATEQALNRCDGSWGLVVMNKATPDELVVACNGSPLVIGLGQDATYIASETSAFNRYTKSFISMKDGEIGVVHADGRSLDLSRIEKAPDQEVILSPAPWPHWTIKETFEQPEAIGRALGFGGRLTDGKVKLGGLDGNVDRLSKIKHMTLSACGTSLNAAMYGAKLMRDFGSFESAVALDAAETTSRDLNQAKGGESGLIVVSQSGETKDVQVRSAKSGPRLLLARCSERLLCSHRVCASL